MLCNDYGNDSTYQYSGPTSCEIINNGIYIPVRQRYENTETSAVQPNVPNQVDVTTSMVKAFQQQALLSNTLMSMPVFLEKKILLIHGL